MTPRLMTSRRLTGAALLAALLALAGCSSAPPEGDVSGTITIDGQPSPEGTYITFTPSDGIRSPQGAEVKEGKYAIRVPVGATRVAVRAAKKVSERKAYDAPNSPMVPKMLDILPKKYNEETTLTYDVVAGKQEKSWELSTKGK